ncbi:LysM peptidoglycan-binding domain-containing protein [Saprospiraceae bacterium]|nr:LysM peptidoglycan-binding domain-containing protein [Saprospiraceae bacterium]
MAIPKKRVAHNSATSTRSQVVDDPFETKSDPIAVVAEDADRQFSSNAIKKANPIAEPDNSFSLPLATKAAGAEPGMDCPKPLVQSIPETGLTSSKINTDSIQINQLRSVSNPTEFDSSCQPIENTNDFATVKPAVESDGAGGVRPESSSFDSQASFYENLSQSIPEPDLLTSPQKISETAPSRNTIANQEIDKEPGRAMPKRKPQSEEVSAVHRVQPGDSFWTIAQLRYGDGRFFRALYLYNEKNVISFDNLPAGTRIDTPSQQVLIRLWPEHCPASKSQSIVTEDFAYHVTQAGDTLFGIAAQRLGQASRYLEILELNSHRLPNDVNHLTPLKPGIHVLLPAEQLN